MSLLESRPQPLVRYVGVDLRRGERRVPEHLLHAAQVGTALQQMGRHRVPKSVRAEVGRPLSHLKGTMDDPAHHPRVDPLATLVRETMEGAMPLDVPLTVDIKVGPNWESMTPLTRHDAVLAEADEAPEELPAAASVA